MPITIDGLWSLDATPDNKITFSAGPHDEKDGLVGSISATPTVTASN
jgi:hypothetical protein